MDLAEVRRRRMGRVISPGTKVQFTQGRDGRQSPGPQINADFRWSNKIDPKGGHGFSRINTDFEKGTV